MSKLILPSNTVSLSRRRFVQGLAAGGALMGLGLNPLSGMAAPLQQRMGPQTLRGNRFDLTYSPTPVNFTGSERMATAINGSVPAPVLRWKEGETVTLTVKNMLATDTSIHWHGLILPYKMDGVPGISFNGIKPGESFTYRFPVIQSGTYWYHSHSGFQEQTGAYGAIIIDPKEPEPFKYDRDYVVMLSDWSDEDPTDVYARLKKLSHYYNFRERTLGEQFSEMREKGLGSYYDERSMWNCMRMSDRDISDVTGYTYTFLMNGVTPAEGWMGLFKRGEKVRLRFINAAAMTFFDVRIPGLKMTVVAADGNYIEPVSVDEFRIGVAETYDVIVEPKHDHAYSVFAQAIDRSGYARGTLTPDPALTADVPPMDPAPILTHADMGMGADHECMGGGHAGHNMSGMNNTSQKMDGMDHSGHNMQGMDHSGHNMQGMDHSQHGMQMKSTMGSGRAGYGSKRPIVHADTEQGPHIDMLADGAQYRLDDPGVGLRNNGRHVLTYADLRNLKKTPDLREPEREIDLHLTGNMSRYMWSINGVKYAESEPLRFKYGERLRINFINDTMMNHPMHLHGMWSDLETGDPKHIPRKHTVIVQPGSRISYLVTADAKGEWAYHCHLIYHMAGMFRKVVVK
ncbi:MAG: copper resistance system multicopper oxidase [Gammaproteobacteria bacterium]|nr:copper resistance system multicopper oxidase [Gammaproteobacteria bacterium]MDH5652029.1 copper resistance system multicopper oxidase [Gammaproteobacteria bacterium]